MASNDELRVGQGFRETRLWLRGVNRVVFITRLDVRYAYVRGEAPPHRRSRVLRSRLSSPAFLPIGEMGTEPEVWPKWFREETDHAH